MGRRAQVRVSYRNDAAFLLRLADAIERDPRQPEAWKERVVKMLHDLGSELIDAPGIPSIPTASKTEE